MSKGNSEYMRVLIESLYLQEASTLSALGVDDANVSAIHSSIDRLRHDIEYMQARNKTHLKAGLEDGGFVVSIGANGEVGVIANDGYDGNTRMYKATIWSGGKMTAREFGPIGKVTKFIPKGKYYVRAQEDKGGAIANKRPEQKNEIGDIVEQVYTRVYDRAQNALKERAIELNKKMNAAMEIGDDGFNVDAEPEREDNPEYTGTYSNKSRYIEKSKYDTQDSWSSVTKNFEAVAGLYKRPAAFDKHLKDTIKRVAMSMHGERPSGYYNDRKEFTTSQNPDNWEGTGRHSPEANVTKRVNQDINPNRWNDDGEATDTHGQAINKIALNVIRFYRNLIWDQDEVRFELPEE